MEGVGNNMNLKTDISSGMYKIDLYQYDQQIIKQVKLLENANISPENRQTILNFINYCKSNPKINNARTIKYMYTLRRIGELAEKPFQQMDENDINKIIVKISETPSAKKNNKIEKRLSSGTIDEFRKSISKFWRWMYNAGPRDQRPEPIRNMVIKTPKKHEEPEIFTRDEIKSIIDGTTNIRDKAFFACLYDLQCRVSELLSRQIKHIRVNENGDFQILIEADKTRTVHWEMLFESLPYFTTHLRMHPDISNPEAPLWCMKKTKYGILRHLSYPYARKIFLNIIKKKKIRAGKKSRIHMIRKSKATHDMLDGVPIPMIESRGSWVKGSSALHDCYLAVHQQDKNNAYRKKYNIPIETDENNKTELRICPRCQFTMNEDCKFCSRCGMPANLKIANEMQETQKTTPDPLDIKNLTDIVKRIILTEMSQKPNNPQGYQ